MKGHKVYPKIAEVTALPKRQLLVRFRNGVTKLYDCKRLLKNSVFAPLRTDDALFKLAHAEPHVSAVIWNDELDVAESEVWIGGKTVRREAGTKRTQRVPKPFD